MSNSDSVLQLGNNTVSNEIDFGKDCLIPWDITQLTTNQYIYVFDLHMDFSFGIWQDTPTTFTYTTDGNTIGFTPFIVTYNANSFFSDGEDAMNPITILQSRLYYEENKDVSHNFIFQGDILSNTLTTTYDNTSNYTEPYVIIPFIQAFDASYSKYSITDKIGYSQNDHPTKFTIQLDTTSITDFDVSFVQWGFIIQGYPIFNGVSNYNGNIQVGPPTPTVPNAPTNVVAVAKKDGTMTVSWSKPLNNGSPITSYIVTSSPDKNHTNGIQVTSDNTNCTFPQLILGKPYTFTVVAANSLGSGVSSSPSNQVIPATVPNAPTNVVAVAKKDGSVTVSWSKPLNNGSPITSYTVVSFPDATHPMIILKRVSDTNCTFPQLSLGKPYRFTVYAINKQGIGMSSSPSNQVIPATFPNAPTNVMAAAKNDGSVRVSWSKPLDNGSSITSYTVTSYQGTKKSSQIITNKTNCTFLQLSLGKPYIFTVVAENSIGKGKTSSPSKPVTPQKPKLNKLVDVSIPEEEPVIVESVDTSMVTPISNICFPANTPIVTDQGIFPIQHIQPTSHTIGNKKIVAITQSISTDKYLVCFEKNALGPHYPSERTIMTQEHKVCYKGQMREAWKFVGRFEQVRKIPYHGEILYNVLLEQHGTIHVNHLLCETLHPKNLMARLYTSSLNETDKNNMIVAMNDSIDKKDPDSYKKIIHSLKKS
jgi:hypothetical protein